MSWRCLLFFLLAVGMPAAEELPDLLSLSDPEFAKREQALSDLETWILKNHKIAKATLLNAYLKAEDPEARIRMLSLMERAYFPHVGYVGIMMEPAWQDPRSRFRRRTSEMAGVRITRVAAESPAEACGLQIGDILVKIGDWKAGNGDDISAEVAAQIQSHPPGTPISLGVERGGKVLQLEIKLGLLPVPSERAKSLIGAAEAGRYLLPTALTEEIREFRLWLEQEIRKDRKNLIAE